jgi:hypothetical protein
MSTQGSEWHGEPHTLTVREVTLPDGPFDDGGLGDYDLEHPSSCKQEEQDWGGVTTLEYTCDVAHQEREGGLASSLRYSGTPVTEPGTYQIQGWGNKSYYYEYGAWEYDSGVGVTGPDGEQG